MKACAFPRRMMLRPLQRACARRTTAQGPQRRQLVPVQSATPADAPLSLCACSAHRDPSGPQVQQPAGAAVATAAGAVRGSAGARGQPHRQQGQPLRRCGVPLQRAGHAAVAGGGARSVLAAWRAGEECRGEPPLKSTSSVAERRTLLSTSLCPRLVPSMTTEP